MPSLYRLFPREIDVSQRYSVADLASPPIDDSSVFDPWRLLVRVASESKEGLRRSLPWLCIFACGGIDVPVATYLRFSSLVSDQNLSLLESLLLVKAVMSSTWLKSMGRQELQVIFADLHTRLASEIQRNLLDQGPLSDA